MKKDPYKNKEQWFKWKENNGERIPRITKENSDLVLRYLRDMEIFLQKRSSWKRRLIF